MSAPTIESAVAAAAMAAGMIGSSPAAIRAQVRDWLGPLVTGVSLDEPTEWSDWDEQHRL